MKNYKVSAGVDFTVPKPKPDYGWSIMHLDWQYRQISGGDFGLMVWDFIGGRFVCLGF